MVVLMSIKPEFVEKIRTGKKLYEYRKKLWDTQKNYVDTILVYETAPIKKITGYIKIDHIIATDKETLWKHTKNYSGISRGFYDEYFNGKNVCNAIKIKEFVPLENTLDYYNIKYPPQNFQFLKYDCLIGKHLNINIRGELSQYLIKDMKSYLYLYYMMDYDKEIGCFNEEEIDKLIIGENITREYDFDDHVDNVKGFYEVKQWVTE